MERVPTFKVDAAEAGTATDTRPRADSQRNKPPFGHRRRHSPSLQWHTKWTADSWAQGRVLLIDYVAQEHAPSGRRKIMAQEFSNVDSLRRFYGDEELAQQADLRVIHVQNAPWATRYLLRKFNIDANDDLVGTSFGKWATFGRPQARKNKPIPAGKTFRAQRDPWRGISRASFGLDYLAPYARGCIKGPRGKDMKMMDLNGYDIHDAPCYASDVYVQRLSVYVQVSDGEPGQAVDPDIPNPYDEEAYEAYQRLKKQYGNVDANEHRDKYIPQLRSLDNGSTIILFENSHSGSVRDTLISARGELESKWRRLTFYLPRRSGSSSELSTDPDNDNGLAVSCMDLILSDVFRALSSSWAHFSNLAETHVSILEDKIYDNPADESRAPELWQNSAAWLKAERLLYLHADVARDMRLELKTLASGDPYDDGMTPWLSNAPEDLVKAAENWERDVMAPTTALSSLMYRSVGIRDARHSLELGLSMWRLSWITFIFLPLTFVVGFFGMNVSTFEEPMPHISYFFASAPALLVAVLAAWYTTKHALNPARQNPLRRGVYETLYADFASAHPSLWTRRGPRTDLGPLRTHAQKLKWHLLTRWFGADKLSLPSTAEQSHPGAWSRFKLSLAHRWLRDLSADPSLPVSSTFPPAHQHEPEPHTEPPPKDLTTVQELLALATPLAIAEVEPTAASRLQMRVPASRMRSLSPPGAGAGEWGRRGRRWSGGSWGSGNGGGGRSSTSRSPRGSGVMVEERSGGEV